MTSETQTLIAAGERRKAELIEMAGGLLTSQAVASILDTSEQTIEEWRKAGAIIAVDSGETHGYPACQFTPDGMIEGLGEVLKAMPLRAGWMRLEWLLVADEALDGFSPLEALREGHLAEVMDVARAQGAE